MAILDLRTILIGYICGNLVCAVVLFTLWQENRSRYAGLEFWMASFLCNLFGIALLAARGSIPEFFSMLLGSFFLIGGTFVLYIGVQRFLIDRGVPTHLYVIIAIYVVLQVYFLFIQRSLEIRNVLFSAVLVFFSFQFGWLLFTQIDPQVKKITRNLGIITTSFGLLAIARIILNILISPGDDPMHTSSYEAFIYLAFQMLYIILTISLFMLVNRRLQIDLEKDITERKIVENALQVSQEKFSKAFQASPSSILITRISDGRIVEVNDNFLKTSGFSREEALNNTTVSLGIWADPAERVKMVDEMRAKSRIKNFRFDFHVKHGGILKCEVSSERIHLGDEDCMLSVIQDISEQQRIEDLMNIRLMLWEYSLTHTPIEIMEAALDEVEKLTGSLIGFYHLVEEDSNELTLQAWSTRTKNVFCHAEGSGMHYSVDTAGVWVDCIRERRPVIHNDYASLPHKKGLPDGHAAVTRELVVPIFQDNRIVAIQGVGNKASDYNNQDIEIVEYIASLVWSIVAKMRADEKIHQLNERLEKLAMTDELTGLPNRRAFFDNGNHEINRSRRYHTPLSLIMMDIDSFKTINDSHGHDIGDQALKCLSQAIREQIREVDLPARLGGEEFGILLPDTNLKDAMFLADRVRMAVENLKCSLKDLTITMTVSLGVAEYQKEMKNLDDLFHNADTALYEAKNNGRNRVVLYE